MENYYKDIPYVNFIKQLSPYTKSHYASFDKQCAKFVDEKLLPKWDKFEKNEDIPLSVYKDAYKYGVLSPDYEAKYGGQPWKTNEWDLFMEIIRASHLARTGSNALLGTLYTHKFVVPTILKYGNSYHKNLIKPILNGTYTTALAISEAQHGSDVSNIECSAILSDNKEYYIVNGTKKWVSNGINAKYYLTAVLTRNTNPQSCKYDITLLFIEKSKGISTKNFTTQGHKPSHTCILTFKDVKVPVKNRIGNENDGYQMIMDNFDEQRMTINIHTNALSKVCFLESIKYAKTRKTFRKPLIFHQVIRHKIAEMGRHILTTHCMIEKLCYRIENTDKYNDKSITNNIALCKNQCSKTLEFVARESSQILGGASYVLGKVIERIYREVRGIVIYDDNEDITNEVSITDALKQTDNITFDNCPMIDWENHISPYKTERQNRWRKLCSKYVENELLSNIDKWEKEWNIPKEVYKKAYTYGVYGARYPKEYGGTPFEGGGYDQFLNYIMYEQLSRCGSGGIFSSVFIQTISIPPVMHFGNKFQKNLIRKCVTADEIIALAISEPNAGSDVANVSTMAIDDGSGYYIVNGMKKWISNGTKADWFITAVKTDPNIKGMKGISLLIIPRTKGVITSRIKTQGHHTSHTALIIFNNVKVPKNYILGNEFDGFKMIMYNFNQERFGIACQAIGLAKVSLYESIKYTLKRKTYKHKSINYQVIKHKLCEMARVILGTYNLMEKLAYGLINDPLGKKDKSIPANISLFKVQATKTLEYCATEASQIVGAQSYIEGHIIDRIYRDVRAFAIYGGSEEIMLDVSLRLSKL